MAVASYALITLEDLRIRLGITQQELTDNTDFQTDLENRINEVSYYLHGDGVNDRGILGRYLKAADYTNELYQGSDEQDLLLDNYPINSITSVEYRYYYPGTFYILEPEEYFIHRKKYSLIREYGWGNFGFSSGYLTRADLPFYNIRITYNAGYTTVPPDIQSVVKDVLTDLVQIDRTGGQGLKRYSIGDITMEWKDSFDSRQMSLIKKYKRIKF